MSIFDSIFGNEEEVPELTPEELMGLEEMEDWDKWEIDEEDDWYRDWLNSLTEPDEEE